MMAVSRSCCCCCSLRTGVLVLDVLVLLGSVSEIFYGITALSYINICDDFYDYMAYDGMSDQYENTMKSTESLCEYGVEPYILSISLSFMISGGLTLIAAIIHIVGVRKGNTGMMVPMIVLTALECIGMCLISIAMFIISAQIADEFIQIVGYVMAATILIVVLLSIYFLSVYVRHRKMVIFDKKEAARRAAALTATRPGMTVTVSNVMAAPPPVAPAPYYPPYYAPSAPYAAPQLSPGQPWAPQQPQPYQQPYYAYQNQAYYPKP